MESAVRLTQVDKGFGLHYISRNTELYYRSSASPVVFSYVWSQLLFDNDTVGESSVTENEIAIVGCNAALIDANATFTSVAHAELCYGTGANTSICNNNVFYPPIRYEVLNFSDYYCTAAEADSYNVQNYSECEWSGVSNIDCDTVASAFTCDELPDVDPLELYNVYFECSFDDQVTSFSPTRAPTTSPTAEPTTSAPTGSPTTDPTLNPSFEPTIYPTVLPTFNPTIPPTTNPTFNPSYTPTTDPTTGIYKLYHYLFSFYSFN